MALGVLAGLVGGVGSTAAGSDRPPVIAAQCAEQGLNTPVSDVNAQAGDQRITVGLNAAGTVTVFKYPNPSFYNQVKYYTTGSDANGNPVGALPNEGSFAGLLYTEGGAQQFAWLRDWPHSQSYLSADTPVPVTTYTQPTLGLTVTDTDQATVAPADAFVRSFVVQRAAWSPVSAVSLVYYEKFSPIASKVPYAPGQDNCLQQFDDQQLAAYNQGAQAIVHSWLGVDASTGKPASVAVAFGWDAPAASHEIGRDGSEPLAPPVGPADGYDQLVAPPHRLGGANQEVGQATGALTTALNFDPSGRATARMIIAPAANATQALSALSVERQRSFAAELSAVQFVWANWLRSAVLPATTDKTVLDDAIRALISINLAIDPDTGAIVASADTETPYGEDWIRDGSFINHALDAAGYHDIVTRHDLFEAAAQSAPGHLDPGAPPGNWPMDVYGDGTPGGPIPFEIDETGFGAWTLWDHYGYLGGVSSAAATAYLRQVYPAIARAATFLSACIDPKTGLQCPADEDDSYTPSQTLHGAGPDLLGLRSAVAAASALGDQSPEVAVWQHRVATLTAAIDNLYDPKQGAYEEQAGAGSALPVSYTDGGWLLWPVQLHPLGSPPMQGEASAVWSAMLASFASNSGGYEGKALLGVCTAWSPPTPAQHQALQAELHFMATQLTTDTGLFGEFWQRFPAGGPIRTQNDMPHVWAGALFYLSATCIDPAGVTPSAITQSAPTSGATSVGRGFSGQLETTGGQGAVTFTQSSGTPDLTVSPSGVVSAPSTLAAGSYFASGNDTDVSGDSGVWSFSLNVTAAPQNHGYWLVGSDGGIFSFGAARFHGSTGSLKLQRPVVGTAPTADRGGYWLVASDGGVFSFGDAGFFGSVPGLGLSPAGTVGAAKKLNAPIVGMVPSADDGGYFMVASDGGVFAFGDAKFEGSCPGLGGCSGAAVAVAPDASGKGYWLVTQTGHLYTFGDAPYDGAPGPQSSPVTSMVRTTDGGGYLLLLANGTVDAYGDAVGRGGPTGSVGGTNPATAIFTTQDGGGYWVASADGGIYPFGDAPSDGSMAGQTLNGSIIAGTGF